MKKFLSARNSESGFTLIELLVVVIIIAILAAIAVPVYIGIQNNAKKSAIQSDVATTKTNVAAALAEDGSISNAAVQNSHSPKNETVVVNPATDGSGNFTVVGSDGGDLGGYTVTFNSATGQQTAE